MRRIRLRVAYDGTEYHGWQVQENGITVEQVLVEALGSLLKQKTEIIGASRTDAGVHALGNVAVFDTDSRIPPEKFALALNRYLPADVRVVYSDEVSRSFHPRYSESVKYYEYTILESPVEIPVWSRYAHHVYRPVDVERMRRAADVLIGTHDFSAFCSAGSQVKDKVRTIHGIRIEEEALAGHARYGLPGISDGRRVRIRVWGNGFLYNMVRIISGTLIEVGTGCRLAESVSAALESGERSQAGPTAPPRGLMLLGIRYVQDEEDFCRTDIRPVRKEGELGKNS